MAERTQARRSGPIVSGDLRAALCDPRIYPDNPARVEVRETHISQVFLTTEHAYKLKKPVKLPFLDYRTRARRREMCREEVRLNRVLAPEVYLGVRAVVTSDAGVRLADEHDHDAIDYLVEMRRYDERKTMAARLRRGEVSVEEIVSLAGVLAQFHAKARRVAVTGDAALALERRIGENCAELLALTEQHAEVGRLLALQRFAHAFSSAFAQTIDARAARGCVREVHGDLRAEHVLLGDAIQIVDCLEFDERLRKLDVGEDLAFLVMDLTAHGGERLAGELLRAYRQAGGDPGEDRLVAFHAAQRALVRAKVQLLQAAKHPASDAKHGVHSAAARDLIELAERLSWRARLPVVIVVCGLPAAGKSQLAHAICRVSGLAHLSSDVTRKRLAGLAPQERAEPEHYSAQFSKLTYAELGRRAAAAARVHGGAVVDATFRRREDREAFAQSFEETAPVLFVECEAPVTVRLQRASAREDEPEITSDASPRVVSDQRDSWQPLEELAAAAHLTLRSDRRVETMLTDLLALMDERVGQLAARAEAS